MKRLIALIVAAVFWAAPVDAQDTAPDKGDAPAAAPSGSAFDMFVAFAGIALVMLVVCYPARRN